MTDLIADAVLVLSLVGAYTIVAIIASVAAVAAGMKFLEVFRRGE